MWTLGKPDEGVIRTIRIVAFTCAAVLSYIVLGQIFRSDPAPQREDHAEFSQELVAPQQAESPLNLPVPVVPPPPPLPKPASHRSRQAKSRKAIEPIASRALAVDTRSELSPVASLPDQTK